jgi:hypothetical protein
MNRTTKPAISEFCSVISELCSAAYKRFRKVSMQAGLLCLKCDYCIKNELDALFAARSV